MNDSSPALLGVRKDERGVVWLTLQDPQRFNALSDVMLSALQQALDDIARDSRQHAPGQEISKPVSFPD